MNYQSLEQLKNALGMMDTLVFDAVRRAQEAGFDPNNTLKGLVITDEDVAALTSTSAMNGLWGDGDTASAALHTLRDDQTPMGILARAFSLTDLDIAIVLLCLAPELDHRYERLYGYLQDDITQRRPSVNLLMNILGAETRGRFAVWERLTVTTPLRKHILIETAPDPTRPTSPFLTHQVRLDRRIVSYLLGDGHLDERIQHMATLTPVDVLATHTPTLIETIYPLQHDMATATVLVYGKDHQSKRVAVESFCAHAGLPLLRLDTSLIPLRDIAPELLWRVAVREAILHGALVMIEYWELLLDDNQEPPAELWQSLEKLERLVFLSAEEIWEPKDLTRAQRLIRVPFDMPDYTLRKTLWLSELDALGATIDDHDLTILSNKFRFSSEQITRSVLTAADWAATRRAPLAIQDLYQGAQAHASLKLDQLAKKITPRYAWEDLILPPDQVAQLEEVIARSSFASVVHYDWGFGDRGTPIRRVSALFAGDSGTGKTLAAEVIAGQLGLVMYKIDLSSVVSKYIGETEKNLKSIFDEAQSGNAILFFDEADALLGKRSEVKDAHDRYANIEVAYLLQQIENYDGVAIMATNLRQNLDDAFTRRLDFVVDFPFPDAQYRYHIWKVHFPTRAPLAADVDLQEVAERYRLAGGNIRNAALASAYLAASEGSTITMQHIRRAIRREHQKMGRLLDAIRD